MTVPPALPWEESRPTIDTLRRYVQIVGKIKLASAPPREHSWHSALYVSAHGLSTHVLRLEEIDFEIDVDLIDHAIVIRADRGRGGVVQLRDGGSVADAYGQLFSILESCGIHPTIKAVPYQLADATPFALDTLPRPYDGAIVAALSEILHFTNGVLAEFAGWFVGKTSPVHFFWHSFDLVLARYSPPGRAAEAGAGSDDLVAFGFWPGDPEFPRPSFYSYTAPEPAGLALSPLTPASASWAPHGGSHLALLAHDDVRVAADPRGALLDFFESAFQAGARAAGWPVEPLRSRWAPAQAGGGEHSAGPTTSIG